MARPRKTGIDYFSIDVNMLSDRKTRRVMRSCGAESIAVIIQLLCLAYSESGYFLSVDDNLTFDVADTLNMDEKYINDVILACVESEFFCKEMFEVHDILTSRRMQENYREATRLRVDNEINALYLLVSNEETYVNNEETAVSNTRSTQSKVKETKVKQSKADNKDDANINKQVSSAREEETLDREEKIILEEVFGAITEHTKTEYIKLEKQFGWALLVPALRKTKRMGGETINYTRTILEETHAARA